MQTIKDAAVKFLVKKRIATTGVSQAIASRLMIPKGS